MSLTCEKYSKLIPYEIRNTSKKCQYYSERTLEELADNIDKPPAGGQVEEESVSTETTETDTDVVSEEPVGERDYKTKENQKRNRPLRRKIDRIVALTSTEFVIVGMSVDEYIETYGDKIVAAFQKGQLPGAYTALTETVTTRKIEGDDFKPMWMRSELIFSGWFRDYFRRLRGLEPVGGNGDVPIIFTFIDKFGNEVMINLTT